MVNSSQHAGALHAAEDKLLACVHCGLCLEACPTYVLTGDENDSPRGRIYLMRGVKEGRLAAASATFKRHINRCLGCRACEAACPAGVEYGQLLEAAREDQARVSQPRTFTTRLLHFALRHVWVHPARLRLAFTTARIVRDTKLTNLLLKTKLARFVSPRLEFALALLEASSSVKAIDKSGATPQSDDASQNANSSQATQLVSLFTGCVTENLFARVNRATRRVLEANDCQVTTPQKQVCCGALHAHAGDMEGARRLARRNIEAFAEEQNAPVVTNAGGCGAMLLSYDHLLADDENYAERARPFSRRVRDISQQLEWMEKANGASLRHGAKSDESVTTYDASCHLLYGQRASEAPLKMLSLIPDLRFVPLAGSDVCCGGAGVYNLLEMEMSERVLREKLNHIKETGAEILTTGNPGCHMQIAAGARLAGMNYLRVCHPVELLDESYERAGLYEKAKVSLCGVT